MSEYIWVNIAFTLPLVLLKTFSIIRLCLVILAFSYHALNIEYSQCIEYWKYVFN